jgi:hypothetical protein
VCDPAAEFEIWSLALLIEFINKSSNYLESIMAIMGVYGPENTTYLMIF